MAVLECRDNRPLNESGIDERPRLVNDHNKAGSMCQAFV
jgi:hypothetical protein